MFPRTISHLRPFTLLLALVAAFPVLASGSVAGDDTVKEFKKYFRKYKDTPTRVEAVLALEGIESEDVIKALMPVLKDPEPEVVAAAIEVLAAFEEAPQVTAVVERLAKEKHESVRVGLLRVIEKGGYKGAGESLVLCLSDKSWEVRRRAVKALASSLEFSAVGAIIPLCDDPEAAVRCAALEGLAALGAEQVLEPARRLLVDDDSWQVRASAILALKKVRHKDSIAPLIERMTLEEGRLKADIGDALAELTGRNFGQRTELWQRFWDSYKDRFEIPTDEELRIKREALKSEAAEYKPGGVNYHGIESPSRSILFIIDVSGSMESLVVEKDRFAEGDYPGFSRIEIVKTELARTIERLEPYVKFNIVAFATKVKPWKKKLVPANVLNKSSAADFIKRLEAIGGASRSGLASAGLTGSANLGEGKTNTYEALITALDAAGRGVRDKAYEVAVDTIFFLSDGRPSTGKFVDTTDILREINAANELRKVVIHTIAIGEFQKHFMEQLARNNGGVFVDLGR